MKKEEILNSLLKSLLDKKLSNLEKKNTEETKDLKMMQLFFTKQELLIQTYNNDIKIRMMTRQKTTDNLKVRKKSNRLYTPSNVNRNLKNKERSYIKEKDNFSNLNRSKIDGNYKNKKDFLKKSENSFQINHERKTYKTPIPKLKKIKKRNKEVEKIPLSISSIKANLNENNLSNKINKRRIDFNDSLNRPNKSFVLNNKNILNKSSNDSISHYRRKSNNKNDSIKKKSIKIQILNKEKANLFLEKFEENKETKEEIKKKNFGDWLCSNEGRHVLISISNYLDIKSKYNLFSLNKNYIKFLYELINDKYTEFKEKNKINPNSNTTQEKLDENKENNIEYDLNIINHKFNISIGASKALEILNKKDHMKFFDINKYESFTDDIYLVYKIIFQLTNNDEIKNAENKKDFHEKMVKYIQDNVKDDKIGDLFKEMVNNFVFSKDNIIQIKNIIKGNEDKLKPKYYSKICATTGFVIFLVKDILDYLGLNNNKTKFSPSVILANLEFIEKMKTKIPNYLKILQKYIKS